MAKKVKDARVREGEQILIRFPPGSDLRSRLDAEAKENGRRTTAEVIHRLEQSFKKPTSAEDVREIAYRIEGRVQDLLRALNSLKS
ncbi:MAG: Arc family DNA-binding protein [Proteobacteria bacterium]|nr:Arc family DNA-binding protein [Pseudomonadota bacterium]